MTERISRSYRLAGSKTPLERELHELDRVSDTGGSALTLWIVLGRIWLIVAVVFVILVALALCAYRLAS